MLKLVEKLAQVLKGTASLNSSLKEEESTPCKLIRGRFAKLGNLGTGISGKVYLARDALSQELVAIKEVEGALSTPDSAIQILREVSILEELTSRSCPYVTRLIDFWVVDDTAYLALEYGGVSLSDLLDQNKISSGKEEIIALELLKALDYLHRANLVHRDIKPQNVLVDEDFKVRLCDFGLARSLPKGAARLRDNNGKQYDPKEIGIKLIASRDERAMRRRDLSPHVITRWYRPPEVLLLEQSYNEAIDIWSAGCVIGEMVTCTYGVPRKDSILFKGQHSLALSPPAASESSSSPRDHDQLKTILKTFGALDNTDKSFVSSEEAFKYLRTSESTLEKIRFDLEFPETSRALTEVLAKSLQFNPYLRWTAGDLARVVSKAKAKKKEKRSAPGSHPEPTIKQKARTGADRPPTSPPKETDKLPIYFWFDAPGTFDYEGFRPPKFGLEEFKEMIAAVAQRFEDKALIQK